MLSPDPLFFTRRVQLVTLATRYGIPAIYTSREFAQVGGLMSYGPDLPDVWRQVGNYIGRILKGAKPGALQQTREDCIYLLAITGVEHLDLLSHRRCRCPHLGCSCIGEWIVRIEQQADEIGSRQQLTD